MLAVTQAGCGRIADKLARTKADAGVVHGEPFVLGGPHAVKAALWAGQLSGSLVGASDKELYKVMPADKYARRVEVRGGIAALHGVNGALGFFSADDGGLTLWNSNLLVPKKRFDGSRFLSLSDDGSRAALASGVAKALIVDTASGDTLATFDASDVVFSPDAHYALVTMGEETRLEDLLGKRTVVLRRGWRKSDPAAPRVLWMGDLGIGESGRRYFKFREKRLFLESDRGLELIALPEGEILGHTDLPYPNASAFDIETSADGKRLVVRSAAKSELTVWEPEAKPPLRRIPNVSAEAACAGVDAMTPKICPGAVVPSQRYELGSTGVPKTKPGERECQIIDRASRQAVVTHSAACEPRFRGAEPYFRADDKYFGALYRGGLFAIELPSGKVEGLGDLTSFPLFRAVSVAVVGGVLVVGPAPKPVWLTAKAPPPLAALPDHTLEVKDTSTHRFALTANREQYTLHVWDRAGQEVLVQPVPGIDPAHEMEASDNVVYVARTKDYLRCEIGVGCAPVDYGGHIESVDGPWVVLGNRPQDQPPGQSQDHVEPHLFDTVTKATRPLPKECGSGFGVYVLRDGPQVICPAKGRARLAIDASGKAHPISVPEGVALSPHFLGRSGDHVFLGPTYLSSNAEVAVRYDLKTHESVMLYLSADGAVAVFPDGKVETFGDEAAQGVLRCLDGDLLRPWSECRAGFEVKGRL